MSLLHISIVILQHVFRTKPNPKFHGLKLHHLWLNSTRDDVTHISPILTTRCRGILWDTFDVYPDVPEGTFFSKTCRGARASDELGLSHGLTLQTPEFSVSLD